MCEFGDFGSEGGESGGEGEESTHKSRFTGTKSGKRETYGKEDFIADFDRTGNGQELVLGLDKVRGRLRRRRGRHDAEL